MNKKIIFSVIIILITLCVILIGYSKNNEHKNKENKNK